MAVARFYTSIAQPTTLAGGISNTNTSIQVGGTTGFPTSYPYTLALDYGTSAEELVDVTNAAGTTLTVTRGVDGTSAQSHSIGATVRHTSSGRDFADFQTHAAATAGVHGVAGTLVGTSDAQTLANKTLTSPSISGATLSGTLAGSPTFSGAPSFTGGGALSGTFTGSPTLSGSPILSGAPSFTGGPSFSIVRPLFTRAAAASAALGTRVSADTVDRLEVDADGTHKWGPGNAVADTNLYRNTAGELRTDAALTVGGNVNALNYPSGSGTTWTPAWTTSTGLHLPSYGNTAIQSIWQKYGRMLVFSFGFSFGTTVNFGASPTTNDNWLFALPNSLTADPQYQGTNAPCGYGTATATGGQTVPITVQVDATGQNFILNLSGGRVDATAITNTGGLDSLTPWTWAIGNAVRVFGMVMVTT